MCCYTESDNKYYILFGVVGGVNGKNFGRQNVVSSYKKWLRCSGFESGKRESYFRDQKLFKFAFFSKKFVRFALY